MRKSKLQMQRVKMSKGSVTSKPTKDAVPRAHPWELGTIDLRQYRTLKKCIKSAHTRSACLPAEFGTVRRLPHQPLHSPYRLNLPRFRPVLVCADIPRAIAWMNGGNRHQIKADQDAG